MANQLRAHLRVVFPGVVGLFADLDSPISLAFLTFLPRFDCQDRADWLSVKRLAGWLAAAGYCGRVTDLHVARGATVERGCRQRPHHPGHGRRAHQRRDPDQDARRADRRTALLARRRAYLHLPAPLRHRPRRPAARRDRGLPSPFPHARIVGLPGWRRPLHPSVRQSQTRRIPLGRRQTTPRRRLRLRR
ncbi:transposase [Mycobacterium tuberculosis CAS/NITR204]|uniref:Transposase n=1 Tax=Mycobacterium tuberculosis CAS/NITR204 TaxID=1310114 RepID=R4M741_MYCTX|nr:transposase [Mycobacterium tuberculosis CAS/NITR204]